MVQRHLLQRADAGRRVDESGDVGCGKVCAQPLVKVHATEPGGCEEAQHAGLIPKHRDMKRVETREQTQVWHAGSQHVVDRGRESEAAPLGEQLFWVRGVAYSLDSADAPRLGKDGSPFGLRDTATQGLRSTSKSRVHDFEDTEERRTKAGLSKPLPLI